MSLWILDTDHISLHQRENLLIMQRLSTIDLNNIAITIITVEEQLRGWLNAIRQANQPEKVVMAYFRLKLAVKYFTGMQILDFDLMAYTQYLELRRQKINIGSQDLKIASIALSQGGILVTRNIRDFEKVPGIQIENWTVP